MRRLLTAVYLLFGVASGSTQTDCTSLLKTEGLISASATGNTVQEARNSAHDLLINQISTRITSQTELSTKESNIGFEQEFSNVIESVSRMRLDGLQYQTCDYNARKEKPRVVAYISYEDLKKSQFSVARDVQQYLHLMNQKQNLGLGHLAEVYHAYAHTFFAPQAVSGIVNNDTVSNVQPFLESMLRSHLNQLELRCVRVAEHPVYPDNQLQLFLQFHGVTDESLEYHFYCGAYNAVAQLDASGGTLDLLMQPASQKERVRGVLTIMPRIPADILTDHNLFEDFTKEIVLEVDYSPVIELDFEIDVRDNMVKLRPEVRHLSIAHVNWSSEGQKLSNQLTPTIERDRIGKTVELTLNNNPALRISKSMSPELTINSNETSKPSGSLPSLKPEKSPSDYDPQSFASLLNFDQAQHKLTELKKSGAAMWGKKEQFRNPDACWVLLVHPETQNIQHVLTPLEDGRTDLKSRQEYVDIDNQFKGLIAIWVELY